MGDPQGGTGQSVSNQWLSVPEQGEKELEGTTGSLRGTWTEMESGVLGSPDHKNIAMIWIDS